ncbi:TonB family protein [Alloacidobacterium dinghuense]|uniref:TonB family protein n=1 Tax=Alloacidobacterium dinghuense TaxID=2763107 RepID=A0A7G8BK95_9BACT|nr:TonB family protein [Alloacidobacterium dinghuense]QNI32965.1 TonB family protein [Alloacidobacterium dinghuense]
MRTSARIEVEGNRLGGPAVGSLMLHAGVVALVVVYIFLVGRFHGGIWGNSESAPGAIQATLVSSAPTIPLPSENKPTENVLATQTPSPAPAPPAPEKTVQAPPPDAIPIPEKQKIPPKVKQAPQKAEAPVKPKPQKNVTPTSTKHAQPVPNQQNRANYGEATQSNIPRSMASNPNGNNPVAVNGGDFGSRFPWYVELIRRRTAQNWLTQEVSPSTPAGARVYLSFVVSRDGSPSQIRIAQSSGSPSLDTSCLRAVQRVDSYGPLPGGYNGSSLSVSYYCEEPGR